MFHLGVSVAVCVRVGNSLGANRPDCAKLSVWASTGICFVQWAIVGGILMIPVVRNNLSLMFAPDLSKSRESQVEDIRKLVSYCIAFVVVQQLFDGLKEVFNGVIRGCGRQSLGMATSFVSYVLICIPLAYCLAFQVLQSWCPGVPGLFAATCFASFLHSILNGGVIIFTDWDFEAQKAAGVLFSNVGSKILQDGKRICETPPTLIRKKSRSSSIPIHPPLDPHYERRTPTGSPVVKGQAIQLVAPPLSRQPSETSAHHAIHNLNSSNINVVEGPLMYSL
uniref:Uncharacterized protein n=2 Tax=Amorphochlora amoebiformis TaxID=1561963 RepID=A0A7S0DU57_9EUKA|mmetsp:Transcript_6816/g.10578  ORF Transcript_6816/g.10578 Transcript_6816/m.10578 type:complete len:280 (+) Transcript_6816:137-976(+)